MLLLSRGTPLLQDQNMLLLALRMESSRPEQQGVTPEPEPVEIGGAGRDG